MGSFCLLLILAGGCACQAFHCENHAHAYSARRVQLCLSDPSKERTHASLASSTAAAMLPRNALDGLGMPPNPGWKNGRLDRLTEWAESKEPKRPIINEYKPSGFWLWRNWKESVLRETWPSLVLVMLIATVIDGCVRRDILSLATLQRFSGIKKMWEHHLTIATFILTFFLSQAFGYWQKVYNTTRAIQGRINDFCMLLVMGSERGVDIADADADSEEDASMVAVPARSNASATPKGSRGFSDRAQELVALCTRLVRLSHTFFWAATPTASNGLSDCHKFISDAVDCPLPVDDDHIGPLLLSPYGLKALVNSGQLTHEEREALMGTGLPTSQYAYVLLVWVGLHCMEGLKEGALRGGPGLEENLLRQLAALRAALFDIDDFRAGRMPLAYIQLVQVLVDSLVFMSPFALYSELGVMSIPLVGLLALFFRGLLALSKSFLDPFGIEGFPEQNIRVDVLVSEMNFGAAKRWIQAGGFLPASPAASRVTS